MTDHKFELLKEDIEDVRNWFQFFSLKNHIFLNSLLVKK